MNMTNTRIIELKEYDPAFFGKDEIPESIGGILWPKYKNQVAIEFPSLKTDWRWQLTAQGWIGYIPLSQDLGIALLPKVPLRNLFGMLEYAYRLKSLEFLDSVYECQSLEEYYEHLAKVLALRVLDRGRKGFYRTYLSMADTLPYIRGRLDMRQLLRKPWDVSPRCSYHEHTSDIEENQILAWTLFCIARSGMCTEHSLPTIRKAYRGIQGFAKPLPFGSDACIGRLYNRLNEDYKPLHALCRFFLEHSGPQHKVGDRTMLPFLVDMARLYELFVAEWLKVHLPKGIEMKAQEKVNIGEEGTLSFNIDLVLYELDTSKPIFVLDSKYKAPDSPSMDDIAQVVAYAEVKDCTEAVLIYPTSLVHAIDETIGRIKVRSLAFTIDGDLELAGEAFLSDLLKLNK